jgi:protein-S-isoprenylcysteine O-methyltransferase Ste14
MHSVTLYQLYFGVLWWTWVAYWYISAIGVRPAKRALSGWSRLRLILEIVVAIWLVSTNRFQGTWLGAEILPLSIIQFWIGAVVATGGLGFSVWARVHLGEYWSGNVTLKEGHRLIRSGPYALVRHPIYTGILFGMLGSAIAIDQVRGIVAVAIVFVSFLRKMRKEEEWLTEEFGEEYLKYKREVRALL